MVQSPDGHALLVATNGLRHRSAVEFSVAFERRLRVIEVLWIALRFKQPLTSAIRAGAEIGIAWRLAVVRGNDARGTLGGWAEGGQGRGDARAVLSLPRSEEW